MDEEIKNKKNEEDTLDHSFEEPKKKRSVGRIIFNILFTIVVLVILGNAALGVYNFNQLTNNKEPLILTNVTKEVTDTETIYDYQQGLFHIVKTVNNETNDTSWALKPFFL